MCMRYIGTKMRVQQLATKYGFCITWTFDK